MSHLWASANILRGPVDAADFKTYIFPLLFFKRICDVWNEEYQDIVEETGDEQLAWCRVKRPRRTRQDDLANR